jgi:putative methanogenesis marker protein 5
MPRCHNVAKVFIYPATSLILSDLVARFGHKPLGTALSIRERIQTAGLDSPPLQMTPEDAKRGLRWAAVEVPSGVRGRMSLFGPLIDEAEAAVIVKHADYAFGCMGCARTDELVEFLIKQKGVPVLEVEYPSDEDTGIAFVRRIKEFLQSLEGTHE